MMDLVPIKVVSVPKNSAVSWSEGMDFFIPQYLLQKLKPHLARGNQLSIPKEGLAPFKLNENLKLQCAFTEKKPLSSRLPFSYQKVPSALRSAVGKIAGHSNIKKYLSRESFPLWPLDLSADFLDDLLYPKPKKNQTPVLLTHDLDSPEGLKNLLGSFLHFEESLGATSLNFIVPCGWPLDEACLREAKKRGHEIGIHGFDHSNKTPFMSTPERLKRLDAAKDLIARFDIQGYRAPSLLRSKALLRDLGSLYNYDSSIPTSGGLFPVPGNGCASARPFVVEDIKEIPISLPRDGSLLFMGHSPKEILTMWIDCAEKIHLSGGVVVLLTHCEKRFTGSTSMLSMYKDFLSYLHMSGRFYWSTSSQILKESLG